MNILWNLKLRWRLQSKHHTFPDRSLFKCCSQSSMKSHIPPYLLSLIQYMAGTRQDAWGMRPRTQHLESSLSHEGSRHIGKYCQQHWISAMTEVHRRNRGEVLESLPTGNDTSLINFTQTAKSGDPLFCHWLWPELCFFYPTCEMGIYYLHSHGCC